MDITYSIAKQEDIPQLKKLWQQIFDQDSIEYINFFYDWAYRKKIIVVAKADFEVVGMVHLLPYQVNDFQHQSQVYYIVGVAVKPKWRGRRIMQQMFQLVKTIAGDNQIQSLLLIPEAAQYYTSIGFRFCSEQFLTTIDPADYPGLGIRQSAVSSDTASQSRVGLEDFIKALEAVQACSSKRYYEAILDYQSIVDLYEEHKTFDGMISEVAGNLILYYNQAEIVVRRIYYRQTNSSEEERFNDRIIFGFLAQFGKKIVFSEINQRQISRLFPFLRKNIYIVRPYLMALHLNQAQTKSDRIFFNQDFV